MKPDVLYTLALALHVALLAVFTQSHFYKRNPAFWLWLACGLGANICLVLLRWAGERPAFLRAQAGSDVLYYLLTAVALVSALARTSDPVNHIIWRGLVAGLLAALVARLAGDFGLAGRAVPLAADALNVVYLFPAGWMLLKFAGLRLDANPLLAGLFHFRFKLPDALGYARQIWG